MCASCCGNLISISAFFVLCRLFTKTTILKHFFNKYGGIHSSPAFFVTRFGFGVRGFNDDATSATHTFTFTPRRSRVPARLSGSHQQHFPSEYYSCGQIFWGFDHFSNKMGSIFDTCRLNASKAQNRYNNGTMSTRFLQL